jgi:hypothetical protein
VKLLRDRLEQLRNVDARIDEEEPPRAAGRKRLSTFLDDSDDDNDDPADPVPKGRERADSEHEVPSGMQLHGHACTGLCVCLILDSIGLFEMSYHQRCPDNRFATGTSRQRMKR